MPPFTPVNPFGLAFILCVLGGGRVLLRPGRQKKLFQIKIAVRQCAHYYVSAQNAARPCNDRLISMERADPDCKPSWGKRRKTDRPEIAIFDAISLDKQPF
jgi:hypothetical protein